MKLRQIVTESGSYKLNVATLSLSDAINYAQTVFHSSGKDLYDVLPDFDKNYQLLKVAMKNSLGVSRYDMPVIEPTDIKEFEEKLKTGHIDIFKPYAMGHLVAPTNMDKKGGEEWVNLGFKDGEIKDDQIKAKIKSVPAKKLLPSQSQIWFEKIIGVINKLGPPTQSSPITKMTIITSKGGYILDGHHRFGQVMLVDPSIKLRVLFVPVDINTLIKVGRTFGNAIGNQQKR